MNRDRIDTETKVCAVFGDPVAHSLSPLIHNAAYAEMGQNVVYVAHRVTDIGAAIGGVRAQGNYLGLSVTIPHKVSVMAHLDEIDELARRIGAVNTVTRTEAGELVGTNTDGLGALRALGEAGARIEGEEVVVLGSGGAARAVCFTLAIEGRARRISILHRREDEAEAERLCRELGPCAESRAAVLADEALDGLLRDAAVVVNTTPLGMHPRIDHTPIDAGRLAAHQTVMDVVYNPLETRLLREARARGCRTVRGAEMFLYQAAAQIERWTGRTAPVALMRAVLMERLER